MIESALAIPAAPSRVRSPNVVFVVVFIDAGLVEAVDAAWRDLEGRGRNAAELMAALHRLSKIRPDL
jgi:hypothetical protein